jgi:hypothetical protein
MESWKVGEKDKEGRLSGSGRGGGEEGWEECLRWERWERKSSRIIRMGEEMRKRRLVWWEVG